MILLYKIKLTLLLIEVTIRIFLKGYFWLDFLLLTVFISFTNICDLPVYLAIQEVQFHPGDLVDPKKQKKNENENNKIMWCLV